MRDVLLKYVHSPSTARSARVGAAVILLLAVLSSPILAQPVPTKEGTSTHVFPAGGRRGTSIAVRVGTECMPPQSDLTVWGAGVTASKRLVAEARGGTEPSPRRKPTEIPINYPREWEASFDIATDAPLGVAYWRLSCASGGTSARPFIVGDLPEFIETESNSQPERAEAVALPVTINGRIAGERDADYFRFHANAGQSVRCEVVSRRIGSPLDPVVWFYSPSGDRIDADETHHGGDPVLSFRAPSAGDYRVRIANVGGAGGLKFVYRLTLEEQSPPDDVAANSVTERPVAHTSPATAQLLSLPAAVTGRFLRATDESWYVLPASKDERIAVTCDVPLGSSATPIVELFDMSGKQLVRRSSVEMAGRPCAFEWTAPADATYRLRLRDVQHGVRGDPTFLYRLNVSNARPDFTLSLKSDFTNIAQGETVPVEVIAERRGGFSGPIELAIEGLPPGVTVESATIAENQSTGSLKIAVAETTLLQAVAVRIIGRATLDGQTIARTAAAPHAGVDSEGVSVVSPTVDHFFLTIKHKPLLRVFCSEAYQYAHRGTIYPYAMEIERLNGFTGEVVVQLGDRQNRDLDGVDMLELRIPPGRSHGDMPIYFPETMHINVQSQTQLYTQGYALFQDPQGRPQAAMVVSEKRNLVRTMPTVARLTAVEPGLTGRAGEQVACRLIVQRTANCPGPLSIELVEPPAHVRLARPRVELPAGATEVDVPVHVAAKAVHPAVSTLKFRAMGKLEGGATVVSETFVTLRID